MKTRRLLIAAIVAVMAVTAVVSAQRAAETMQVTVVEVPVTVVDRDGNAVRGLTASNFELYDEGKRVPIDYFEAVDLKAVPANAEASLPPAANRNFLLLFDLANSSPGTIGRASEAAKEFVANQLGERDSAAVSVFTAESGAKMITNFTKDKVLLVNAIETLGHPKYFKVADPLMISAVRSAAPEGTAGVTPGQGGRAGVDQAYAELAAEQQRMQQSSADNEARNRLRIQFTNMGNIARVLDRLHGQKQIILLSEGFDARLVQGRQSTSDEAQGENDKVMAGEVWNVDNEQRFGSASSSNEVRQMTDLFRRSDVVLHAIDIKGLRGTSDVANSGGSKSKGFESLYLLTSPTGGTVFKNTNDISATFDKMLKQQEVVYVLGFQARSTGKPGKFHTLKVKTNNNSKVSRLSHRVGYYEPNAQMSDLERTLTLAEILMTDAPIDDVKVNVGSTTLPGPGGKARVPVVVEIPGKQLTEELKGDKANAQLFLYAFNADSQVVDFMQQRISLDLAAAGDTVRKGGVRYYGSLKLPPGKYSIKALVRVEETGRIGFKRENVVVPAFDKAEVMAPVLFEEPGNWAMLFGPSRGDEYGYPFAAGTAKYIPKSEPEVAANGSYKVALFLYRVPIEDLSVVPTVVTADGASHPANVKLLGRTSADDRGSVKLLFDFKPESIAAGTHQLRFDVKAKDGSQSVVSLPFTVRAD